MAVAKKAAAPRSAERAASGLGSEARVNDARMVPPAPQVDERVPQRDPNKIYTRDGRVVDLARVVSQENDYSNLPAIGVFAPDGWHYEWHTVAVKGAEYTEGIVRDAETGWTPVPASRHDGKIMPRGHTGHIEKGGQRLMECDVRLKMYLDQLRVRAAAEPVINSRSRMGAVMANAAPNSGAIADFNHPLAQRATGFRKVSDPSQSGVISSNQRNYNYTLEE